jgi:hypothetical protein
MFTALLFWSSMPNRSTTIARLSKNFLMRGRSGVRKGRDNRIVSLVVTFYRYLTLFGNLGHWRLSQTNFFISSKLGSKDFVYVKEGQAWGGIVVTTFSH